MSIQKKIFLFIWLAFFLKANEFAEHSYVNYLKENAKLTQNIGACLNSSQDSSYHEDFNNNYITQQQSESIISEDKYKQEQLLRNAYDFVYEADEYFETENYAKAIEIYDLALNLDNFNFLALIGKGQSHEMLNQIELAIDCYDKVISIDRHNKLALVSKGNLYLKFKQQLDAIKCFDAVLAKHTRCLDSLNGKATAYLHMKNYKNASLIYSKALEMSSNDVTALMGLADVLYKLGRFQESYFYYRKVLDIDEKYSDFVLVRIGYLLAEMNNYKEAINYFDIALNRNPNNVNASIAKTYTQTLLMKQTNQEPLSILTNYDYKNISSFSMF